MSEKMKMIVPSILNQIQIELKVPKNQVNTFGKYKYRSAEDILEAIKPHLKKHKVMLKISEELLEVCGVLCLKSTATLYDTGSGLSDSACAYVGVDPNRKGMDMGQSFGASSSYAKKYALGNLFLLDDTKDLDALEVPKPSKQSKTKSNVKKSENDNTSLITEAQKKQLRELCKDVDELTIKHIADAIKDNRATQKWADAQINLLKRNGDKNANNNE